jgi:hypothetical protein
MKITDYDKNQLQLLINDSNSFNEFLVKLGYSSSGNAYRHTKKYLDSIGVDYGNLTVKRWSSKEKTIDEVFTENINFCNKSLKSKILKYGLLDYVCSICTNNGSWMDNPLSLHLDHINGNNNDEDF